MNEAQDPNAKPPQTPGPEQLDLAVGAEQAGATPAAGEALHVCFHCSGELVYPLDWCEEGARHWRVMLRCPECESRREGVFEQTVVEGTSPDGRVVILNTSGFEALAYQHEIDHLEGTLFLDRLDSLSTDLFRRKANR